jgi:hypothetical protein
MTERTNSLYTQTVAGPIPHLQTAALTMPVRLVFPKGLDHPAPVRDGQGRLLYALPGGGVWAAG